VVSADSWVIARAISAVGRCFRPHWTCVATASRRLEGRGERSPPSTAIGRMDPQMVGDMGGVKGGVSLDAGYGRDATCHVRCSA
jgi:hypothetical protein